MLDTRACVVLEHAVDRFTGVQHTDVVYKSLFAEKLDWFITHKDALATGRYRISAEICDANGGNAVPVRFFVWVAPAIGNDNFGAIVEVDAANAAAGYEVPAAAAQTIVVRVPPDAGHKYNRVGVRLTFTETVDSPVEGSVTAFCAQPNWGGDSMPSMLA